LNSVRFDDAAVGKHLQQPDYAALDQVNARGFQWLEKTCGQAQANAVPVPVLHPLPGAEAQQPGFCNGFAVEIAEQGVAGFIVAHELAAIDEAIANPGLQWNTPLPAALPGNRACIGSQLASRFRLHRDGSIAGQPVSPILELGTQGLAQQ
jgi:hypothetical protein